MKTRRNAIAVIAASLAFAISGLSLGADPKKPDGTVSIDETQFAVIVGGSVGGGKLTYQGKVHEFKISGLTAGANVGVSKMTAAGEVYDLKDIAKFPGTYTRLDVSATAGGGVGALHLKNENGVVMKLTSRTQGLQLNEMGYQGVKAVDTVINGGKIAEKQTLIPVAIITKDNYDDSVIQKLMNP